MGRKQYIRGWREPLTIIYLWEAIISILRGKGGVRTQKGKKKFHIKGTWGGNYYNYYSHSPGVLRGKGGWWV